MWNLQDGKLKCGDRLLAVDGHSLECVPHSAGCLSFHISYFTFYNLHFTFYILRNCRVYNLKLHDSYSTAYIFTLQL